MKKIVYLFFTLLIMSYVTENYSLAQEKKFKFSSVARDTKKLAKKYEKDGFQVLPGRLPIKQQLNDAYNKQAEVDDQGFPKYLIANGASVANTQAAAQMQALELAKQNLVSLIESNMRAVIENQVANDQMTTTDAASITKTMQVSVNKVAKKLSRVMELFTIYRVLPNKNIEVQVMIGYSYALAQQAILDEMKLQMKNESENMQKKYDQFLNPETYQSGTIQNVNEDNQ
jgi:hypothetical protein